MYIILIHWCFFIITYPLSIGSNTLNRDILTNFGGVTKNNLNDLLHDVNDSDN